MSIVLCYWPNNGDIQRFQLVLLIMHCVLGAASIFFMASLSCFCCCFFLLFQLQSKLLGAPGHAVDETNTSLLNQS